jgi:hypothetical protein
VCSSDLEAILVGLAIAGALFYLGRRAWRRLAGRGAGCCGNCPVGPDKIRLVGRGDRESIKR